VSTKSRHRARVAIFVGLAATAAAVALLVLYSAGTSPRVKSSARCTSPSCHPITQWRKRAGFHPLSDSDAAAHVRPATETRPANASANADVPSDRQLRAFYASKDESGTPITQHNPYLARVTGRFAGTTDEIVQWAAWKWGIPEDWLRAQYVNESDWRQSALGDRTYVGPRNATRYPPRSREKNSRGDDTGYVWQSMGITQVKWRSDGTLSPGTEPLRWESTPFNVDYEAATVRFFYDDPQRRRSAWGDSSYKPGNAWLSIAGWFRPYPWDNPAQRAYANEVRGILAGRTWARPRF
jgi:hypothetical protein